MGVCLLCCSFVPTDPVSTFGPVPGTFSLPHPSRHFYPLPASTACTALHYVPGTAPRAFPVLVRVILTTALHDGPQYHFADERAEAQLVAEVEFKPRQFGPRVHALTDSIPIASRSSVSSRPPVPHLPHRFETHRCCTISHSSLPRH